MLKKLDHPVLWVILCSCFFAGFGFAVGEAVQRVNDAVPLNAMQPQNILELVSEYFDPRVTLFTVVFVTVAALEAGFFFHQLCLKRQITQATVKAKVRLGMWPMKQGLSLLVWMSMTWYVSFGSRSRMR